MTKEQKDLLLADICARLPYGLIVACDDDDGTMPNTWKVAYVNKIIEDMYLLNTEFTATQIISVEETKPYLFPMSSITEEQYNSLYESGILDNCSHNYEYVNPHIYGVSFIFKQFKTYSLELIEWLNKNHFDYRGLIDMGLAIDATNLNIY